MRIALAADGNILSGHFGHCSSFHVYEIEAGKVKFAEQLTPPPHEPGVIPNWLSGHNIDAVLTGGMGRKAKEIFESKGIEVVDGLMPDDLGKIAEDFAKGNLKRGNSTCDH